MERKASLIGIIITVFLQLKNSFNWRTSKRLSMRMLRWPSSSWLRRRWLWCMNLWSRRICQLAGYQLGDGCTLWGWLLAATTLHVSRYTISLSLGNAGEDLARFQSFASGREYCSLTTVHWKAVFMWRDLVLGNQGIVSLRCSFRIVLVENCCNGLFSWFQGWKLIFCMTFRSLRLTFHSDFLEASCYQSAVGEILMYLLPATSLS